MLAAKAQGEPCRGGCSLGHGSKKSCVACRILASITAAAWDQGVWAVHRGFIRREELLDDANSIAIASLVVLDIMRASANMAARLQVLGDDDVQRRKAKQRSWSVPFVVFDESFALEALPGVMASMYHTVLAGMKQAAATYWRLLPDCCSNDDLHEGLKVLVFAASTSDTELPDAAKAEVLGDAQMCASILSDTPEYRTYFRQVVEALPANDAVPSKLSKHRKARTAALQPATAGSEQPAASSTRALSMPHGDADPLAQLEVVDVLERRSLHCLICFEEKPKSATVVLGCRCSFCRECLAQHCEAVGFPRCPTPGCGHEFTEEDFYAVCGEGQKLERFRTEQLKRCVDRLPGIFRCPAPSCGNIVEVDRSRGRQQFVCGCGAPPSCTGCQGPYHYHVECNEVQETTQRWLDWVSRARQEYHGLAQEFRRFESQRQAVEAVMTRQVELQQDEKWKEKYCRLCPKCRRPIQKTEGCSSMKCGEDYHGGSLQPGCGHTFNWDQAPRYTAAAGPIRELPALDGRAVRLRVARVRHHFVKCDICGETIVGPRLRCIHCPSYDLCTTCDLAYSDQGLHPENHVFSIVEVADCDVISDLQKGAKVTVCDGTEFDGWQATVVAGSGSPECPYELHLTNGSTRRVLRTELEPVVASDADVVRLLDEQKKAREKARAHEAAALEQLQLEEAAATACLHDLSSDPIYQALPPAEKDLRLRRAIKDCLRMQCKNTSRSSLRGAGVDGPRCRSLGCQSSSVLLMEDGLCIVCSTHEKNALAEERLKGMDAANDEHSLLQAIRRSLF
eukprot:gnl/TRDRNA2_/TRDRNA2_183359_c0_seq1.p1 gnl/TRDRNA2_/TRDRNA2_183359_c0~~gnl/TRDRNA2_/TRDRNA2_183359_c0_seq1.p1  ORF type:complete len:817 (+),score=97.79 gnl/TRDRNA2_/TRDRNA2_183359_c0_seq1:75-2453(+)